MPLFGFRDWVKRNILGTSTSPASEEPMAPVVAQEKPSTAVTAVETARAQSGSAQPVDDSPRSTSHTTDAKQPSNKIQGWRVAFCAERPVTV